MEKGLTFKQKIFLGVAALLLFLNVLTWQQVFIIAGPHYLKVDVLDIGQGDSIFIETPNLRHIIIDGGPDSSVLTRLSEKLPFWQKHLDVVMLTHPDADHVNGLLYVLQKYQVDYIVWTGITREGTQYEKWLGLLETAKKHGTKIIIAKEGTQIKNDKLTMDILHPFESLSGQFFKAGNDTGIVSRLMYGQKSFLFTADISSDKEAELISHNALLASDMLKVAHHGSKYSSSAEFLQAVKPKLAVISVGADNTYGHPTPEVLQRLSDFGISTLRTDQQGTVEILSDGNNIKLK